MQNLANRPWVPCHCEAYIQKLAPEVRRQDSAAIDATLERLARVNRDIHARDCINLIPASNAMNPRAEAMWAGIRHLQLSRCAGSGRKPLPLLS